MSSVEQILERLEPLRRLLLEHPVYARIDGVESLHVFMQHHVFAVWDFMSLLKSLQRRLTCVEVPWLPLENRSACRFVNEIVLGEESDEDGEGGYASHFDLYREAMRRCGADASLIGEFLNELRKGNSPSQALEAVGAPQAVQTFLTKTFDVLEAGDLCAIASTFAFGREDLLPDVFRQLVDRLAIGSGSDLDYFKYYLERHIELDDDQHGPMAAKLIEDLCGDDLRKWKVAEEAAVDALEARLALWDGVEKAICKQGRMKQA